ncbi:MAG: DUF2335 domain-containing protein [Bacteroidota bacterium]
MSDHHPVPNEENAENEEFSNEPVETQLSPRLKEFFDTVPEDEREEFLEGIVLSVTRKFHSGPLPSPEHLKAYNEIIPSGAERIMKMTEQQMMHRQELEKIVIPAEVNQGRNGQIFGRKALKYGFILVQVRSLLSLIISQAL